MALPNNTPSPLFSSPSVQPRVMVIILAGGEGKRLRPLTEFRCKPAVRFGGRYALIDVPLSHALHAGLHPIFVIGQFLAHTLSQHLLDGYYGTGQQIHFLVPESREGKSEWYGGTADAIRKNVQYLQRTPAEYFLVLSGDQLYNIDFSKIIHYAFQTQADAILACLPVQKEETTRLGLVRLAEGSTRIIDFIEKPSEEKAEPFYLTTEQIQKLCFSRVGIQHYLGSMGIYLFRREVLFALLREQGNDFGKDLITKLLAYNTHAFVYDGYWEDIGTIASYYHANLRLTEEQQDYRTSLSCYKDMDLLMTKNYRLPGARLEETHVQRSIICEGSVVYAQEVVHSILGIRSAVGKGTKIYDSILMGNEFYTSVPLYEEAERFSPHIGSGCLIKKAIIDENVVIGEGSLLVNQHHYLHYDDPSGIYVRDGIIIVPKNHRLPAGFVF